MSRYLMPEHPSFACDQAWFVYAVANHRGPGFCRLILVEAKSHAAVAFLERVGDDCRVSATVSVMTVHRQCPVIGIRSDLVEEVSFPEFANDMVDRDRVDRDPLAVEAYREATSGATPSTPASAAAPRIGKAREDALEFLTKGDLRWSKAKAEGALDAVEDLEGKTINEAVAAAIRADRRLSAT